MKRILLLLFIAIEVLPFTTLAGSGANDSALRAKATQWMSNTGGLRFLENKGQMMDMQRKPVPNVLYEASSRGMDVYVTTSGLSYVFVKLEKHKKNNSSPVQFKFKQNDDSITETYCRADMQLVGADIRKENIIKEDESENRTDYYYGGICPDGILNVHSYEKVTIKNIYPGIDWVLHSEKNGLKYDFIVHPGADPSQIKLKYKWTDKPQLQEDGSIKISTPMGAITEGTPISYCSGEQVQTTYIVKDSEIYIKVSHYNSTQLLIIDPTLVWGTYYDGGANDIDDVFSMQEDGSNVWITGGTASPNFPTFNPGGGAYFQGTLPGTGNMYILQFNIAGVLIWSTYYGGNGKYGDRATSINSDGTNVWVTGYTCSSNFPILNPGGGAYFQGALAGSQNAFILQFTTAGIRKWATFYGGNSNYPVGDEGNSIYSDGHNVWVTGQASSTNFPTLNPGGGAYFQGTLANSYANVFILQFSTAGVLKWATYYGGDVYEVGYSICSDGINVWVTGSTESSNFPTLNPGGGTYFQGALAGTDNIFILKFDMGGVCKWATYYGDSGLNLGSSINSDGKNVWLTGYTASANFPTMNPGGGAYFQGALGGTYDAFILNFDTAGIRKWATYYGGTNTTQGFCIQSDGKHVWVCGATSSTNFPLLNPGCGYYDDTLGNINKQFPNQDVFISQFNMSGVSQWATYYGDDMEDDGSFIWSDGTNLFVAGDAEFGSYYPTVNPGGGAFYQDTGSGIEFVFVGKFILSGGRLSVGPGVSICRGDSARLSAADAVTYSWSPPTGLSATNIPNPMASPKFTTTYTVTGTDTGICAGTRVDSVKVIVDTMGPIVLSPHDTSICSGSSISLNASGGTTYIWSNGSTTSSTFIANDTTSQTYTVAITNGACHKDTSMTVKVVPLPKPVITGDSLKCFGIIDTLTVSSPVNPTTYLWRNGSTSTSIITGKLTSDTTIYVTAYNSLGCPVKDSFKVMVQLYPLVTVNPPAIVCSGTQTRLKATATGTGPFTYKWSPGGKTTDTITVNPDSLTYYFVKVSNGCTTTKTTWVEPDNPSLEACCNNIIFAGDDTVLVARSPTAKKYEWSPQVNCLNPSCDSVQVSPTVTTTYTVISTDSAGCQVERIITIVVEMPCADFAVPNVFTPNDPGVLGLNSLFYIKTFGIQSWSIIIYDRWGKEMFHSSNPTQYWDGNTENGGKAPDGVYYYIINATCRDNAYKKDGFVQLIR